MLRRRSSFEFGRKSILYLVLASAFNGKFSAHCSSRISGKMLPLPKPYDAQYKEFGCVFADNEYKINRNPNNKQFPAPTWSEEGIDSMSLTIDPKDNYWKPIGNYLSEDTVMNDVSPFVEFVAKFKLLNNDSANLESFFNDYDVPFVPFSIYRYLYSNPAAYVIQMFRRLKEEIQSLRFPSYVSTWVPPPLKQSQPLGKWDQPCYLVSAYVDPMEENISDAVSENGENTRQDKLVQMLRQTRVQDHLAGIAKIDSGNRTGYILMDPGYANGEKMFHPFVVYVMEDGKHPHGEFINVFRNSEKIKFTKRKETPFILANYKNSKSVTNVLYYVGKPYCSFMENTIKASLLRLNHGIIARQLNEKKKASYLTMKISPEFKGFSIRADLYNAPNNERITKNATEAGNYIGNSFDPGADPDALKKCYIPLSPEDRVSIITEITEQLKLVQSDVLAKAFMNMFSKLAKNLGVDKDLPEDFFVKDDDRIEEPNSPIGVTGENLNRQKPKSGSGLGSLCCITRPKVDD
uniref:Uncharacterized protein n=1 Tax=Cacopsylla melanoneura TaxID=428564 RepID=A0A8D8TXW7_9HEMI